MIRIGFGKGKTRGLEGTARTWSLGRLALRRSVDAVSSLRRAGMLGLRREC